MKDKKIAIIGGGNLGTAIAEGLLISGEVDPSQLAITRRRSELLSGLQTMGVSTGSDNIGAVKEADIVLIAVKPYQEWI
jgi:pyrroline-5-carboxylate reductase